MKIEDIKKAVDAYTLAAISTRDIEYPEYIRSDISDLFHERDKETWEQWKYLHEEVIPSIRLWPESNRYMLAGGVFRRLLMGRPIIEGDIDLFKKSTEWFQLAGEEPETTLNETLYKFGFARVQEDFRTFKRNGQKYQILDHRGYGKWPMLPAWLEDELSGGTFDRATANSIVCSVNHLEHLFDNFDTTISCCGAYVTDLPEKLGDPFPVVVHYQFAKHGHEHKLVKHRSKLNHNRFLKLVNEGFMPADYTSQKLWEALLKHGPEKFMKGATRNGYGTPHEMQGQAFRIIRPLGIEGAWAFGGGVGNDNNN